MECIACKATNPDDNHYCGQCGAELGRTLDETIRKKGFRDRSATEMEITCTVLNRLMKGAAGIITLVVFFLSIIGYLLGKDSMNAREDIRQTVEAGKSSINTEVQKGFKDISGVRQNINVLKVDTNKLDSDIAKLNSDIVKYKKVTLKMDMVISKINKLQNDVNNVKRQISGVGSSTGVNIGQVIVTQPKKPQINNANPGISGQGGGGAASQK